MADEARVRRNEYLARINRVLDHIDRHLDSDLSLEALARVACFSPFHFHRVFHALVGETPAQLTRRLRLERAASRLARDPRVTVLEVALDAGFSGPEVFARAFREAFGTPPSEWRDRAGGGGPEVALRKDRQALGKPCQDGDAAMVHPPIRFDGLTWRIQMDEQRGVRVEVREVPDKEVAYVRHIGPYKGDAALFGRLFDRLFRWAGARGLLRFPETEVFSVYHDDPGVTGEERLRTSVCVTVPADTPPDAAAEIGRMTLPGGLYAVAHFALRPDEYEAAWGLLYGTWLPESGYQPDDRPAFEQCHSGPCDNPDGRHEVDIFVPVRPL